MRVTPIASVDRFIKSRLSPEGAFGLHLTIGIVLILLAGSLFAEIAGDVVAGNPITLVDVRLAQWLHAHPAPAITWLMLFVAYAHSQMGIVALASLFGFYLHAHRERYWMVALALTIGGGLPLNVVLKHVFQRARPSFDDPLLTLSTYSFPSGHTSGSTLLYGLIAAYLVCHTRSWWARIAIVFGAGAIVGLTGLSRMYLGVHYLSDILAAMSFSVAWLALCVTSVSSLRRHRTASLLRSENDKQ